MWRFRPAGKRVAELPHPESRILNRVYADPSDLAGRPMIGSLLSSMTCGAAMEYRRHAPAGRLSIGPESPRRRASTSRQEFLRRSDRELQFAEIQCGSRAASGKGVRDEPFPCAGRATPVSVDVRARRCLVRSALSKNSGLIGSAPEITGPRPRFRRSSRLRWRAERRPLSGCPSFLAELP